MQSEVLLSAAHQDGEAAQASSCLSILLWPPFSTLLAGAILLFVLIQFPIPANLQPSTYKLSTFFTPQVLSWESEIIDWAEERKLDPNLVATVMQIESCGDPHAVSGAGAMGLFQVMPYHFGDGEDPYSPNINATRGLDYLLNSLENFSGDVGLALAGYNGGIGGASRPRSEWAQETIDYEYWGKNIYAEAIAGRTESPTLEAWLAAGGASLCAQAAQFATAAR
jgi:soluble lytic murein transglycosylase-like protein